MITPNQVSLLLMSAIVIVRDATPADLPAIERITNHEIANSTANWSETVLDSAGVAQWHHDRIQRNFPVLVAAQGDVVVGFGTYVQFRTNDGYRSTVEDSLYVDPTRRGQRIGKALLTALIGRAQNHGHHIMVAGIDATNEVSIELHRSLGFTETGRMPEVGRKFGRWLDLVLMQKMLSPSSAL